MDEHGLTVCGQILTSPLTSWRSGVIYLTFTSGLSQLKNAGEVT